MLAARRNERNKNRKNNPTGQHSRRGLRRVVGRRRKRLAYLQKEDVERYRDRIATLGLRK